MRGGNNGVNFVEKATVLTAQPTGTCNKKRAFQVTAV